MFSGFPPVLKVRGSGFYVEVNTRAVAKEHCSFYLKRRIECDAMDALAIKGAVFRNIRTVPHSIFSGKLTKNVEVILTGIRRRCSD